jgi:aminoglycoside N3'-acetyltransferase
MIQAEHLSKAVDELVPPDRPVMVHASLRSFGSPITGGADALLDALLGSNRTVLMPTFTEPQFGLPAPAALLPARNGIGYAVLPAASTLVESAVYTVDCGLINPGLGVLPATLISRPEMMRGTHPLNSFAALGPLAHTLISRQSHADVYGPISELAAHGGVLLLIGVGLNRMTALHLAEQRSGRRLFQRWARSGDRRISTVEVGSCSEGFPRLEPFLGHLARTAVVGGSQWRAFPAWQTLATATAAMTADKGITRCADSTCLLCRDSIAGGPIR